MSTTPNTPPAYLSIWPEISEVTALDTDRAWPKISIVTPNFNEEQTLERTIRSVTGQKYPNLEYIVVDDGSSDRSVEIIRRNERDLAQWETHENRGQYATINKGFSFATGEIFGWLNSDDIYLPWTLRAVAEIFTEFPDVDWIMGLPATIQNGIVYRVRNCRPYPRELLKLGFFHGPPLGVVQQESCFWRRSLWEKAGPLDETFKRAADFELWTRFARHASLVCCDTLLTGFTRTGKNRSVTHAGAYQQEVERIRQELGGKLPPDDQGEQKKIARQLDRYARLHHYPTLGSAVVKLGGLGRHRGPTLRRNFQTQRSILKDESLLAA